MKTKEKKKRRETKCRSEEERRRRGRKVRKSLRKQGVQVVDHGGQKHLVFKERETDMRERQGDRRSSEMEVLEERKRGAAVRILISGNWPPREQKLGDGRQEREERGA